MKNARALLMAPSASTAFARRALVCSLGLFGLMRLTFVEPSLILVLRRVQGAVVHELSSCASTWLV